MSENYLGNPNLFKANTQQQYTEEQIREIAKCMEDPIYFIKSYTKIVNIDDGLVPFEMYKFQEKMVDTFHNNRFSICKLPRQSGKSTTIIAYLLHQVIFNDNINVAILANKSTTARDLLGRLQLAYENLPTFLQQGVLNWNKGSLELENGSKILAAATSSSAIRGGSFNIIFLDEFAFIPANISEQFFSSVYPTISSGKKSKVMIVSTPHGMNMFYKLWNDAIHKRNDYKPIEVHWSEVPGRDDKWKEETIRNTSEAQFATEFECEFVGSVDTLLNPSKIRTLSHNNPLISNQGLDVYEQPQKGKDYVITVDVARGTVKDYSAFVVFDVSQMPYKIVAKYRNNEIKPLLFPHTIERVAKNYNNAHVCVEVNDVGHQVADALQFELEYTNLLMCMMKGRAGQILGGGFSKRGSQLGVRMTKQVKRIGCTNLKTLIEGDKLIVQDFHIIEELSTFVRRGQSWAAEEGSNDDLTMCLVIFAWISNQRYFKELTDQDVRARMYEEQKNAIEQDMAPFGFLDDGLEEEQIIDDQGEVWNPVSVRKGL
ncbi:MAG: terminase [Porticoccaceae bacterium]|nr:terminase [Porticoccaceae bacterium]OUW58452.1 MAG: terminase [Candidatus Pelagibacter sp. TMED197]